MTAVVNFLDRLRDVLEVNSKDGIEGWGLNSPFNDGDEWFIEAVVGPEMGCRSETCNHYSHDPSAPVFKYVPTEGTKLYRLGEDGDDTYYMFLRAGICRFVVTTSHQAYWDEALEIGVEDVPDHVLLSHARTIIGALLE